MVDGAELINKVLRIKRCGEVVLARDANQVALRVHCHMHKRRRDGACELDARLAVGPWRHAKAPD